MLYVNKKTGHVHAHIFTRRINTVREALRDVRPQTEHQWMNELLQGPDPDRKLAEWETVTFAYTAFFEARTPTDKAKNHALCVLLDCIAGCSENELHKAAYKALSIAEIRSLIAHYTSARQTMQAIARFKKD